MKNSFDKEYFNEFFKESSIDELSLCSGEPSKPYSDEDYENAKKQGLDLENWDHYQRYCKMGEYSDETDQYWW